MTASGSSMSVAVSADTHRSWGPAVITSNNASLISNTPVVNAVSSTNCRRRKTSTAVVTMNATSKTSNPSATSFAGRVLTKNTIHGISPIAAPAISAKRSRRIRVTTGAGTNSSSGLSNRCVVSSSTGDCAVYMVGSVLARLYTVTFTIRSKAYRTQRRNTSGY